MVDNVLVISVVVERGKMAVQGDFMDYTRLFLQEFALLVKENTLKRYENDLTLFYLYLERFGCHDVRRLNWNHIEEFFSWWYLRQYMGCSLTGARGLFATLKKFCRWLDHNGIVSVETTWIPAEYRKLKENVERILQGERDVAERRAFEITRWFEDEIEEAEVTEGWFKVIHTLGSKGAVRDMDDNAAYIIRFEGLIADYIKPGDIISAALCRDDRGLYVNDSIVWFFYPPMAHAYIR